MKNYEKIIYAEEFGIYIISAKYAFELYSSFGYPLEYLCDLAKSKNMWVDCKGFYKLMEDHKNNSRITSKFNEVKKLSIDKLYNFKKM